MFLRTTTLDSSVTGENLIDKIRNDASWEGLRDAVKLIASLKHDKVYTVNAKPVIYNREFSYRRVGIAVAYRGQVLQELLK